MNPTLFAGFMLFAVVSSITPGPNNLMMMASGWVFGLKRTVPHMAGVVLGFGVMTLAVGLGLAQVLKASPLLFTVLRWGAAAYILYIAFRMVTAKGPGIAVTGEKPMSFLGAVAFQWINPKAWVMALAAVGTYAEHDHFMIDVAIIAGCYMVINVPSALIWTGFGSGIRRWFKKPGHLKGFNWTMAAMLVASLYPLITEPL
ncbi:MAG TPA: LysE family translocator [Caulobacteraceae bacterium]|jgi:threonine/homoserine/homoserine lactone efflux protein